MLDTHVRGNSSRVVPIVRMGYPAREDGNEQLSFDPLITGACIPMDSGEYSLTVGPVGPILVRDFSLIE